MKTGLITSDTYQNHNTGDGHPEKIDRVTAVIDNFKRLNNKNLIWKKPSKVTNKILETTHDTNYIDSCLDRLGFILKSIAENSTTGNTTIILFPFNAQMAMDRILIAELDCKIN